MIEGHHFVDKSHLKSLLRRILTAEEPYLTRLLLTDDTGQVTAAESGVERADLWSRLSEDGIFAGYGQVAD